MSDIVINNANNKKNATKIYKNPSLKFA